MTNEVRKILAVRRRKLVLEYAALCRSDANSYRYFEVARSTFYRWKKAFAEKGEAGLIEKARMKQLDFRLILLSLEIE